MVTCVVGVWVSAHDCWQRIGSFADAGKFLDVPSKLVAGNGNIGSFRQIGEAILEVMVGQSGASYTYAPTQGPMAQFLYHGCAALTATGPASCTLSYNEGQMDAARRVAERSRIAGRFQGAAEAMKRVAEAAV